MNALLNISIKNSHSSINLICQPECQQLIIRCVALFFFFFVAKLINKTTNEGGLDIMPTRNVWNQLDKETKRNALWKREILLATELCMTIISPTYMRYVIPFLVLSLFNAKFCCKNVIANRQNKILLQFIFNFSNKEVFFFNGKNHDYHTNSHIGINYAIIHLTKQCSSKLHNFDDLEVHNWLLSYQVLLETKMSVKQNAQKSSLNGKTRWPLAHFAIKIIVHE